MPIAKAVLSPASLAPRAAPRPPGWDYVMQSLGQALWAEDLGAFKSSWAEALALDPQWAASTGPRSAASLLSSATNFQPDFAFFLLREGVSLQLSPEDDTAFHGIASHGESLGLPLALQTARQLESLGGSLARDRLAELLPAWLAVSLERERQHGDASGLIAWILKRPELDPDALVSSRDPAAKMGLPDLGGTYTALGAAIMLGSEPQGTALLTRSKALDAPCVGAMRPLEAALTSGEPWAFAAALRAGANQQAIDHKALQSCARAGNLEWLLESSLPGAGKSPDSHLMSRADAIERIDACQSLPELFAFAPKALGSLRGSWGDALAPSAALARLWSVTSFLACAAPEGLRLGYQADAPLMPAEDAERSGILAAKAYAKALLAPAPAMAGFLATARRAREAATSAFFQAAPSSAHALDPELRECIACMPALATVATATVANANGWFGVSRTLQVAQYQDSPGGQPSGAKRASSRDPFARARALIDAFNLGGFRAHPIPSAPELSAQVKQSCELYARMFKSLPLPAAHAGFGALQVGAGYPDPAFGGFASPIAPIMVARSDMGPARERVAVHEYGHIVDNWCSINFNTSENPASAHKLALSLRSPAQGDSLRAFSDLSHLFGTQALSGADPAPRRPGAQSSDYARAAMALDGIDATAHERKKFSRERYYFTGTEMLARSFELFALKPKSEANDPMVPTGREANRAIESATQLLRSFSEQLSALALTPHPGVPDIASKLGERRANDATPALPPGAAPKAKAGA